MGCTSSTSIIPEDQIKSTVSDKSINSLKGTDTCNNKNDKDININEQEFKKDFVDDVHRLEQINSFVLKKTSYSEQEIQGVNFHTDQNDEHTTQENTSFKEIVEHVISTNIENQKNIKTNYSNNSLSPEVNYETETHTEQSTPEIVPITTEAEHREECQESGSPGQSDSSRATRWEALADMAAELPPSLTVDPITGQIYTVSK